MEPIKVARLEATNFKRLRAVEIEVAEDGLTVIGGANRAGKTSVLDAIAWALGGDRLRPASPNREGAATKARLRVELSNGLVAERKGANGDLRVTDPEGRRAGQQLLNGLLEELALDLPRFLGASDRQKAETLLKVIGVGDELQRLDEQISAAYGERTLVGRDAERKAKAAEDMTFWEDAPAEPVSAAELIREQQGILARNGENQRKRARVRELEGEVSACAAQAMSLQERIDSLTAEKARLMERWEDAEDGLATARKTAEQLEDESTEEIEASIASIELTNAHVRENAAKRAAEEEAESIRQDYRVLSDRIDALRCKRLNLLENADLPLPGLSVEDGVLLFEGHAWEDMSGSDQLKVATAIVRAVKPSCGFVLVDKLEQMDRATLMEFGLWCASEGIQVIGTRVADDDTCSLVIEDGRVRGSDAAEPDREPGSGPIDPGEEW